MTDTLPINIALPVLPRSDDEQVIDGGEYQLQLFEKHYEFKSSKCIINYKDKDTSLWTEKKSDYCDFIMKDKIIEVEYSFNHEPGAGYELTIRAIDGIGHSIPIGS